MKPNAHFTAPLPEMSRPGLRAAAYLPAEDGGADLADLLGDQYEAHAPDLPELSEPDVVRHFVNLSHRNMSVDTHFYPLGSCTMKYNPKRHERLAGMPGLAGLHPHQRDEDAQGTLQIMHEMQRLLGEISGLPAVSLQPAAGAHGELTALLCAAAYFRDRGETQRTKVFFPESAHGTNPASARTAGFETVQLDRTVDGLVDVDELKEQLGDDTACFMVTNPNTVGLFEKDIKLISDLVHEAGGLVYIDGANLNAIVGLTRPGDFGGDMMHFNVHKTFTGPHGGGGPGSGPIGVCEALRDFLPGPVVEKHGDSYRQVTPPKSIGRVRSFFGNVGILLRGYFYLRTLGPDGLRQVGERAVLNANYLKSKIERLIDVPEGPRCMHEFVASASALKKESGVTAMDVAKRLLDYGFHAPTVYFPLVVPEALMIEPTETESKETMDRFAAAFEAILSEDPEVVKTAPHTTAVSRPDEVQAGRKPVLCWCG